MEGGDPRNKTLMKMFNLINIGERAGSGVPNIFNVWEQEGWEEPIIEENFSPDRTTLTLSFRKKQAIKSGDKKVAIKSGDKKTAIKLTPKTLAKYETILSYMVPGKEYKAEEIGEVLGVKISRTKVYLKQLTEQGKIEPIGGNRNRRYRLSSINSPINFD